MSVYISQNQWDSYAGIIGDFMGDVAKDILVWKRNTGTVPRNGEDRALNTDTIELECLFQYNNYRTWPVDQLSDTGEEDKQSQVAIFSIEYLQSLNLLDNHLKLVYDVAQDIFFHRGDAYEATGDTFISQAGNKPILFMIVLKRYDGQAIQKT